MLWTVLREPLRLVQKFLLRPQLLANSFSFPFHRFSFLSPLAILFLSSVSYELQKQKQEA